MHELALAEELLRVCARSLARHPGARLRAARVAVGELSAVEPDLLRYAWEAVCAHGPHAGAELRIEWHAAQQQCPRCGAHAERERGGWLRGCASCGALLQIRGGRELELLDLEIELAASQDAPSCDAARDRGREKAAESSAPEENRV
ncbi:MAG: hydrogenase maturation nickel metallochaperone HypA [Candidatus Eisenbacteria bacterium]|nr:hydrogenase maturation nickel metallochaperone HypA [Candidatus Eisenbacteria bacterium]